MHYMVSVSGGAGSTVAAHKTVDKHGPENVTLVFADTNCEHPTLYEAILYMKEVALPQVPFIWLNDGRNIWDVFNQFGYMKQGGTKCKASLELKRKPLDDTAAELKAKYGSLTQVTGLDATEPDRIERFDKLKKSQEYETYHPLASDFRMIPCQQIQYVRDLGYPEQVMYSKGFPHNNCGGGCVLAGLSQWVGLYQDFPDTFEYHKQKEAEFNAKTGYGILRDRRGGTTKTMLLSELEERIKTNDLKGLTEFRSTCGCMTPDDYPNEHSDGVQ